MGLNDPHIFDDGSSIEWVDRETLRYTEAGRSVQVWVDYAPGFFSRGRIIRTSSLASVDDVSRQRIIDKVIRYYEAQGTPVSLEE